MCSNNLKLPIRAAPYRHQREAAAFALDKLVNGGGAALLMEMGTGKTLTTIAIVGRLWQEKRVQRLLVVAPLSILGVWEDEFRKFADYDYSLAVLEGTGARKADTIRHMTGAALQVLVVNYESAWRLEKELAAWRPDMIVCDEGHKIKTHNIAASKALHRLGAKARYRLCHQFEALVVQPVNPHPMDGETWMNAKKALELGFCDEILYQPEAEPAPEDSFTFSRRAVTNSLLDKLKTRIPKPDNRVSAADLQKRLSRLPH